MNDTARATAPFARTATGPAGAPLPDRPLAAALGYVEQRHWEVVPGAWLEYGAGAECCSCGDAGCAAPGAHPMRPDWKAVATASPTTVRRLWGRAPDAAVLLPTGRAFDVVDVPEAAGCLALARLERTQVPLGPVAATPRRRMLFFVLPGAAGKCAALLGRLGYGQSPLDLTAHGPDSWIPAPPTRMGGSARVQWARRPTVSNAWFPDLEDLINPLAYACSLERVPAGVR
ncbi:bifunctional DNA primase/polymerase [Streptomyces polyrhachis]|uniref:Bifunctional DNA primase/polymerase n=1 Tax=Streptomyces polyrhachis TaxID=1282885 RepID=A0ABW2GHS7_9ACTN